MVNKICSIYREKKRSEKKNGKGSNGHVTVGGWLEGKGEGREEGCGPGRGEERK